MTSTSALRPAILLVTDGLPTDPPGGFERGLAQQLLRPEVVRGSGLDDDPIL